MKPPATVDRPVAPAATAGVAPATLVRVRIGRLALDGVALGVRGERVLRHSLRAELQRLLGEPPLPSRLGTSSATPRLTGAPAAVDVPEEPDALGRSIARAIYARLAGGDA